MNSTVAYLLAALAALAVAALWTHVRRRADAYDAAELARQADAERWAELVTAAAQLPGWTLAAVEREAERLDVAPRDLPDTLAERGELGRIGDAMHVDAARLRLRGDHPELPDRGERT